MKFKHNRLIEFINKLLKCFSLVLKKPKFMLYYHGFNPAIFIDKPGQLGIFHDFDVFSRYFTSGG